MIGVKVNKSIFSVDFQIQKSINRIKAQECKIINLRSKFDLTRLRSNRYFRDQYRYTYEI